MTPPSHAAQLVAAIDRLLEDLHVYRKLTPPYIKDYDNLTELHRHVTRLAVAAEFDLPSPMVEAGLRIWGPDQKAWPPNPPPGWRSPNAAAGEAWEGALRDLQSQARAAVAATPTPATPTPATQSVAGKNDGHAAATPEERCLAALLAHKADNWSAKQFADHLGISRATFYRLLKEHKTLKSAWESIKREPRRGRIDRNEDGSGTVDATDA